MFVIWLVYISKYKGENILEKIRFFIKGLKILIQDTIKKGESSEFMSMLSDKFAAVERNDLRVAVVRISTVDFIKFRKLASKHYDINTTAETLKKGLMGHIWGAEIQVNKDYQGIECLPEASEIAENILIENKDA